MGVPIWKRLMYAIFGRSNREEAFSAGYEYVEKELAKLTGRRARACADQLLREAAIYARSDNIMLNAKAEGMRAGVGDYRGGRLGKP